MKTNSANENQFKTMKTNSQASWKPISKSYENQPPGLMETNANPCILSDAIEISI